MIVLTLQFLIIFVIICLCIDFYLRAEGYRGPKSDHFDGKKFRNILEEISTRTRKADRAFHGVSFFAQKFKTRWRKRPLPFGHAERVERVMGKDIRVTYINHSTVLIQTEGINIITDPVWSYRVSPFPFLGPARYMDPGMKIVDVPRIDILLLTHNHYDHMDIKALKYFAERDNPTLYTTLGNKKYLESRNIFNAVEMDWGGVEKISEKISIECVPAQHFSSRALSDRNTTLWGGFVLVTEHGNIYFAGDTGYGPFISRIQKAYPEGFRLAFLPLGAFEPRWFMHTVHIGPAEALMMYDDLKIEKAIGIHIGTFDLGIDAQDEPKEKLGELQKEEKYKNVDFTILQNGEVKVIS